MSIRTYGCVLEESKREKLSIAKALADEYRPSVPWRNITMNEQERRTAGIAEALRNRPCHPDWGDLPRSIEFRIPAGLIREDFFVGQIPTQLPPKGDLLVLLGDMHV
ncbi:MAG TPA: hypothetical protein VFE27_03645, partial [Acidobacteriaceae bacterium]|nr:hypothetical protein [Acidobacteriaceae bacterium]